MVLTLGIAACGQETGNLPQKTEKLHLVETALASQSAKAVVRIRTGTLRALREVRIFSQEEGRITELPFYEGDHVTKGDVIARLDGQLLESQLTRARATRQKAEQDLKRIRDLSKKNLISAEELSRSETDLEVTKADEEVLSTRLGYTTINAPITGVISERLTEPGNIAERYDHLLTLSDPTSLITEVTLSELLISKLAVNDPVQVRIDALGQQMFPGRVSRIYPNLDPVTRRGTIEVELKPVPAGAQPGQFCRVKLETQATERLTIPFNALRHDATGEYVFIVSDDNRAQRKNILTGLRIDEQIEILDGLMAGQHVITKGFLGLTEDKQVKIVSPPNSPQGNEITPTL